MKKTLIPAFALMIGASVAQAAEPIDSLAAQIAGSNPAFVARQAELQASALAVRAENALPGPEIEGEHLWGPAGDNRWGVGVSQSFDWPGVYGARRRAARAGENAFSQLALAERAELTLAAKLALIDLIAARREASIVAEIYNNVKQLEQFTSRALDHGQATILDYRKLQIEAIDVAERLRQAEQARTEAVSALRAMGFDGDVPETLGYPTAAPDYDGAAARWMSAPALEAARAEALAAAARAAVAARSCLPGFALGYRHQFEGGNHFNGITAAISLPSWGSGKAKAAARAEAEAARLQAESAESLTVAEFDKTRRNLAALQERMQQYADALDGADYPTLLRKSLDGGQISMLTYIQELNFFMEARIARARTEREYHTALATLMKY